MKRRNFIKLSATASAVSMLPTDVFALFKSAGMTSCPNVNAKKLVLIQLAGANDGLNTVVPLNQYDVYSTLRPTIKLKNVGLTNGLIQLDATLPTADQVGLNPAMTGFKNLYDAGLMRIVQGVGYPNQDKSHFKSTDLYLTGGDGTAANNNLGSGWIGRFLENYYANYLTANYPLGIQLGSSENSLGFHGEVEHGLSMNMNGQDSSGFYSIINGLGGAAPTNIPNSDYGQLIQFLLDSDSSTNVYANSISTAFNAGTNSISYPATGLADQLKTVAKFISGGLQTKVYLVKLSGFDTHDLQVADATNTHLGTHANLLAQLSDAVNAFITDLTNQTLGEDVIAVTFSEFGRKAGENGGLGTDHGEISPMFVFGSAMAAGISGTNINLSEAVLANNYQVKTVQHDYRRVFSTILQDWFGVSNPTLDLSFYNFTANSGYTANKLNPFLKSSAMVPASCYNNAVLTTENFNTNQEIVIFPNPTSELITVHAAENINTVNIYSLDGRLIATYRNPQIENQFVINVQSYAVGIYTFEVNTENGKFSKKIIIRR
jgi:uncharacterized protein (DUF1501 family)